MGSKIIKFIVFLSVIYLMAYLFSFSKNGFLPLSSFLKNNLLNIVIGFFSLAAAMLTLLSDIIKRKILLEITDLIIILASFIMLAHIYNIRLRINIFDLTLINAVGFLLILPFSRIMIELLKGRGSYNHKTTKKHRH